MGIEQRMRGATALRRGTFLADERGAVTVDWAVLAAAVTGLALSAAGVLAVTTDRFSEVSERELALTNAAGIELVAYRHYRPADEAVYDALVAGMADLALSELDALAGYANRLHAQMPPPEQVAAVPPADDSDADDGGLLDALAGWLGGGDDDDEDGPGNGHGNAGGQGHGQNGNGNAFGHGHDDDDDRPGNGNGHAHGHGNGNAGGNGHGNAGGQGHGQNGNGNAFGHDDDGDDDADVARGGDSDAGAEDVRRVVSIDVADAGPIHDRDLGQAPSSHAQGETAAHDFVAAVNQAYVDRGLGRPSHTRVDIAAVERALGGLRVNADVIAGFWAGG